MTMSEAPILVDAPEGAAVDIAFLKSLGHPVMLCHGPGPQGTCPLVARGHCGLAERAHGIVFMLDLDRPQHREILWRYRTLLREDLPIAVVVDRALAARHPDLLRGLRVWYQPPAAGDLDALAAEVESETIG